MQQVLVAQLPANPYMPIQHTYSWVQLLRRKHAHTFFHNAAEADVEAGTSSDAPTGAAGSTATAKEDKPLSPKTTEATDGALLILHIDSIRQQHCNNATVEASHTVHTLVTPCMIHRRPEPRLLTDFANTWTVVGEPLKPCQNCISDTPRYYLHVCFREGIVGFTGLGSAFRQLCTARLTWHI